MHAHELRVFICNFQRAWKSVHEEFCKVFGNERNCNRLKEQWRRMKGEKEALKKCFDFHITNVTKYSYQFLY